MRPPGAPSPTGNTIYGASRACKNVRGQCLLGPKYSLPKKVQLGGSKCAPITFLLVDQSSPNFFRAIGDEMCLMKKFQDFRYVDPFRRYLRLKSKVVTNRAEFWTFFTLPKFVGGTTCKTRNMGQSPT